MDPNSEEVPDKKEMSDDTPGEQEFPGDELRIGPVPVEEHYRVFKMAEVRIRKQIETLSQPHYLTGLRVAYDQENSFNEPFEFPFSIEFGDPRVIDRFMKEGVLEAEFAKQGEAEELAEEDLRKIMQNEPIQYDFLINLFEDTHDQLQAATKQAITVGLYVEVNRNPTLQAAVACKCNGVHGKRSVKIKNTDGSTTKGCSQGCGTRPVG